MHPYANDTHKWNNALNFNENLKKSSKDAKFARDNVIRLITFINTLMMVMII